MLSASLINKEDVLDLQNILFFVECPVHSTRPIITSSKENADGGLDLIFQTCCSGQENNLELVIQRFME